MKDKIITIVFVVILGICFVLNIAKKDEEVSASERRKLAQFPAITKESILSGKASEDFDKYTVDQFIFRDEFRSIKSLWSNYVFNQKDNNGLFEENGRIYKLEYPLNREYVRKSAEKINEIYDKYLNEKMNVYYSIIPDKNYYLDTCDLKIDVKEVENIMNETLKNIKYIDIKGSLTLDDYYNTDLHWKEENIQKVVNVLEKEMNLKDTSNVDYNTQELGDFYGAYYGQLGMNIKPDKITVLRSKKIDKATCFNIETQKTTSVYDMDKLQNSADKYDVYLSGAVPIISIENTDSVSSTEEKKELLLFRDSFGSSIAPLLLENYDKITLIDLRYISSSILDEYIDFNTQDVLFIYNTLILNQNVLR